MPHLEPLLYALKPESTVISPNRSSVASFDREGRLVSLVAAGRTYKRSLGSEVHERFRQDGRRQRRRLSDPEALEVFAAAQDMARQLLETAPVDLAVRLETEVLMWTPQRLALEARRFGAAYSWPISILPPDSYLNVVVQASFGCTWNQCTFCNFYQDRPFQARSSQELEAHLEAVKGLLGRGLALRKGVFLADGNALALGANRVRALFNQTRAAFPGEAIYGFIDVFTGERHPPDLWLELRQLGLKRVYIGVETGLDELLGLVNKPGSAQAAREFVRDLKAAGIGVGLIFMIGLGGAEYRLSHRNASLELLSQLPLGAGDLVYCSPFVEHPASAYARVRAERALRAMTEAEVELELLEFMRGMRELGLQAARYDIREFLY